MFLAGLEIDMGDFKRNSLRSLTFGLYTFCVPMALGIVAGYYLLGFSWLTSVLLASMFASHTLIAYPIISKLGNQQEQCGLHHRGRNDDYRYARAVGADDRRRALDG